MITEEMKLNGRVYIKQVRYDEPAPTGTKAFRAEAVRSSTVTAGGYQFDADEASMDRMGRVVDLANWKFNQALAAGTPASDAYQAVYTTPVPWKTYDNQVVMVSVETLCQAQDAAVRLMGETWMRF